jgi:threonine dehydratase
MDPVFRNSRQFTDEQLRSALGRRVLTRVETVTRSQLQGSRRQPVRARCGTGQRVVCASAGKFG